MAERPDMTEVRERSKALFGAQYRVEVGAAIANGDGVVCLKDLAAELGDPPGVGSVNAELKVLERAGLLQRGPRDGSSRKVYLLRQASGYWDLCLELKGDVRVRRSSAGRTSRLS
jgi:hypothetical protein